MPSLHTYVIGQTSFVDTFVFRPIKRRKLPRVKIVLFSSTIALDYTLEQNVISNCSSTLSLRKKLAYDIHANGKVLGRR